MDKLEIIKGDITDLEVDAIVNAANTELILGSGVAGAIRKKGGDLIQKECSDIGPIALGQSVVTGSGNLKSNYVIHAAGMKLGGTVNETSLRNATLSSLKEADKIGLKTIAFPAIGTGVGGLSLYKCSRIMIDTVTDYLEKPNKNIKKVLFVLFDDKAFNIFSEYLKNRN